MTWNDEVRTSKGILTTGISWGWFFLIIGVIMMISSVYSRMDTKGKISISDHLMGWIGSITILVLTSIIIYISYIPGITDRSYSYILDITFGIGKNTTQSGVTRSPVFPSIHQLQFDRKTDALSFLSKFNNITTLEPIGSKYEKSINTYTSIGINKYVIDSQGGVYDNSGALIGESLGYSNPNTSLFIYTGGTIQSITKQGIISYSGTKNEIRKIEDTPDGKTYIWTNTNASGSTLYKNGISLFSSTGTIDDISISKDGSSIMYTTHNTDNSLSIVKNGIEIEKISKEYISGSLQMNGNNSIYKINQDGSIRIVYNGIVLDRKFDEIREIFLDQESNGFVYFGRPLGEQKYCVYTRYRGNLCGIDAYMNPRLSADDASILYAALRNGSWGIYRNASPVISNTGYPNPDDISQDYAFYDITNPNYYLFIRKMTDGYRLYTKGRWIESTFLDVGLDVSFGYDNKIIMSAKDKDGWHIIEF
ncbi:hypothetical protein K2X92_03015 [Candidatus Gracilibacteria bacterium]|nr:hypothetical protein [Candidatus Gracilibacteria bacterium]